MNIYSLLKKYIYEISIVLFFSIIFIINFPMKLYWIGGDSGPMFYTSKFMFNQFYIWSSSVGFGGITESSSYLNSYPILFFVEILKSLYGNLIAQYIFYYLLFLFIPISFYLFIGIFSDKKIIRLLITLFYSFNFLVWLGIHRNILSINILFAITPLILKFIYDYLTKNKLKYLIYIFVLGIFNVIVVTNPGFFLPQLILILSFIIWICFIKHKILLKSILLIFIFLFAFSIMAVTTHLLFLRYNHSITTDYWNTQILLAGPLNQQKETSSLYFTFRGISNDLLASYGWLDGKIYYPFPLKNLYQTNLFIFILFIPILIVLLGTFVLNNSKKKNYYFWLGIFLINLFIFKSSAPPFGNLFEYLVTNTLLGILRNPQQKMSIIFIISESIILAIILSNTKKIIKLIVILLIIAYIISSGFYYFTGDFIPKNALVKEIPQEYFQASNYLNNNNNIKRIVLTPWDDSTWTETNFGFEGYPLFIYLLPGKGIYNLNTIAFSSYNSLFIDRLRAPLTEFNKSLSKQISSLQVDTIIFDGNVNRSKRFLVSETPDKIINYLNSQNSLYHDKTFGKILIYRLKKELQYAYITSENTFVQKINPTKYNIYISNLSQSQNLSFLESYHKEWKLYLSPKQTSSWCQPIEFYNNTNTTECQSTQSLFEGDELSYLYKKPIFDDTHQMVYDYANGWEIDPQYIKEHYPKDYYTKNPDGSINIELVMHYKPQSYFFLGLIIFGITLIFCIITLIWIWRRKK